MLAPSLKPLRGLLVVWDQTQTFSGTSLLAMALVTVHI